MKEKIIKGLKWFFFSFIWLAIVMIVADIITKRVVIGAYQSTGNNTICEIIPGFLNIEYTRNEAAAFGLGFSDPTVNRVLYLIVAGLASAGMIAYFVVKNKKLTKLYKACLMLILSGAIGNMIDRIFYADSGYCVIDWINFYGIWPFHFNIADCGIVIGVIMLIVILIVEEVKEYKADKARKAAKQEKVEKVLSVEEQRREQEKKDEEI